MSYLVYVFGFSARNHLKLRTGCFPTSAYVNALTQGEFSLLEESFPQLHASHAKNDAVPDNTIVRHEHRLQACANLRNAATYAAMDSSGS